MSTEARIQDVSKQLSGLSILTGDSVYSMSLETSGKDSTWVNFNHRIVKHTAAVITNANSKNLCCLLSYSSINLSVREIKQTAKGYQ